MDSEDFDKFLTWLDPEREQAIAKYQVVRVRLIRYFGFKGCAVDSEQLADETIARVTKRAGVIADTYVGERLPYFLGVARKVYLEWLKTPKPIPMPIYPLEPPPPPDSGEEKELLDRCLHRCLKEIPDENRVLILRYYTGDKRDKIAERKRLAEELGVAPNALRIRAHRIRTELRHCVEKCVEEENDDDEKTADVNTGGRERRGN